MSDEMRRRSAPDREVASGVRVPPVARAAKAAEAIAALLDCEMRGTPLTRDQARAILWALKQQSDVVERLRGTLDAVGHFAPPGGEG